MARRKQSQVQLHVRLYPGTEDDALIAWLEQFDDAPYGVKRQAIKSALLRGIGESSPAADPAAPTDIDWSMLRQVVSSAIRSELPHLHLGAVAPPEADGSETGAISDGIAGIMSSFNDEDDDE